GRGRHPLAPDTIGTRFGDRLRTQDRPSRPDGASPTMTPDALAVSYRQTFLSRHIRDELHPRVQADGRLREEVLALENLRYRLGQAFPWLPDDVIRSAVTLRDFFPRRIIAPS